MHERLAERARRTSSPACIELNLQPADWPGRAGTRRTPSPASAPTSSRSCPATRSPTRPSGTEAASRSPPSGPTDFGCARAVDSLLPMGGTPAFMALEVARGEEQGPASDVWALGCTSRRRRRRRRRTGSTRTGVEGE
uniref:Protein kinase domain-containing protein n=1 Tax=Aegilops tauschii subsp. strangulata TaxID=200361 RepID=A0A453GJS3_AEGTS